tara:strand:+ start:1873 stop:2298 length:426 start_codon:yes stop_codon:yes gene_type:complete
LNEEWIPSLSYPDILVSSSGRVKLPDREASMPNGGTRKYVTKPTYGYKTKSCKTAKHMYMNISNRFYGNLKVHQLVCEAFHGPRPFLTAVVIHKDENGTNNNKDNLKWGTQKENLNAPGFIEYCKSRTGDNSPVAKGRLND